MQERRWAGLQGLAAGGRQAVEVIDLHTGASRRQGGAHLLIIAGVEQLAEQLLQAARHRACLHCSRSFPACWHWHSTLQCWR